MKNFLKLFEKSELEIVEQSKEILSQKSAGDPLIVNETLN